MRCFNFILHYPLANPLHTQGPSLLEWVPNFQLDLPLPMRSIPRGRPYSNIVFDPSTSLVVAAAVMDAQFASFDEDGNKIWEPDGELISSLVICP